MNIKDKAITELSAQELLSELKSGRLKARALLLEYLRVIDGTNKEVNAIVILDREGALEAADEADAALARNEPTGPLHGLPVLIKEHFPVRDMIASVSYAPLKENRSTQDSELVLRLREAGAVILGKTNMPELALDFQSDSPIYGLCRNPLDLERTPGGSSGGAAAALTAGYAPLSLGSDLGGSLRLPAAFCGVYSLRPTDGILPTNDFFPPGPGQKFRSSRHMAVPGPMARNLPDLKLFMDILTPAGIARDSAGPESLKDLKILWADQAHELPVAEDIRLNLRNFVERAANAGATTSQLDGERLDFREFHRAFAELVDFELNIHAPAPLRFLAFALGAKAAKTRPLLQKVFPAGYKKYMKLLTRRDKLISRMDDFMGDAQILVLPVSATTAFHHIKPDYKQGPFPVYKTGLKVDDQDVPYWEANMSLTVPFSLTGHPVLTLPVGKDRDGMPIGLQLIGRRGMDFQLLEIGRLLEGV